MAHALRKLDPSTRAPAMAGGLARDVAPQGRTQGTPGLSGGLHRGSLLVITLWLVTILSVLAIAIGRFLSREVRLTRYHTARQQAKALARDGVYLAIEQLKLDAIEDDGDWLADDWAQATASADPPGRVIDVPGRGAIIVQIVDEERKLNLNTAGEPLGGEAVAALRRLVAGLDAPSELIAPLGDAIDENSEVRDPGGLERDETQQPPYVAKNALLSSWGEILELPGLAEWPPSVLRALRERSSIFLGASPQVNANTVSVEALVALGFSENTAQALQTCRGQGSGPAFTVVPIPVAALESCVGPGLTPEEKTLASSYFIITSGTFTIVSEAVLQDRSPVQARIEAVVRRSGCPSGADPCILAWTES